MYIRWSYIEDSMKLKKISNTKMCEKLGISRDTWYKYKNNQTDITLKKFYELMKILDLDFYSIVKETELNNASLTDKINQFLDESKDYKKPTVKFRRADKD